MTTALPEVVVFESAADFRAWLEENHESAPELWVGYYKKGAEKTSQTYAQAVEEALCFGWIDGVTRRISDEVYANRFTPRRRTSNWSGVNIAKVAQLIEQGRMRPAGLRAFDERDRRKDASYSFERPPIDLPPALELRLRANTDGWAYWQATGPAYRRDATRWVLDAKRDETRERRLQALIDDSAAGRRIKPLRRNET
jgi:uncharacterized protein YdeI (YjbR/CyaY-like superfamily)